MTRVAEAAELLADAADAELAAAGLALADVLAVADKLTVAPFVVVIDDCVQLWVDMVVFHAAGKVADCAWVAPHLTVVLVLPVRRHEEMAILALLGRGL